MKTFTFKKHIPIGRYRCFETESHDIKRNKKIVGSISQSRHEENFSIRFIVKCAKEKCGWRWITFMRKFSSGEEAREFVKKFEIEIQNKYDLHELEY